MGVHSVVLAIALSASSGAPWWGVSVLAGVFTVLGAALAQIVTWLLARAQAQRDNVARWHNDRLEAYSAALLLFSRIYNEVCEDRDKKITRRDISREVESTQINITMLGEE